MLLKLACTQNSLEISSFEGQAITEKSLHETLGIIVVVLDVSPVET